MPLRDQQQQQVEVARRQRHLLAAAQQQPPSRREEQLAEAVAGTECAGRLANSRIVGRPVEAGCGLSVHNSPFSADFHPLTEAPPSSWTIRPATTGCCGDANLCRNPLRKSLRTSIVGGARSWSSL